MFQYDKHVVHCVLDSVWNNSQISMLPTSRIIFFDSELKRLNDWFCRRSCWRTCRFGWFSIFWIYCRTLALCPCFTIECGSPGIRRSMFTSFSFVCSWPKLSWSTTGLSVPSRSVWVSNVECFAYMTRTCLRTVWHIFCVCSNNESRRSFMCRSNVGIPTVFKWTCLDCIRFNNRSPRSDETVSSWKKVTSISWERDVFLPSFTVLVSSPKTCLSVLSRLGFRFGWFDRKLLDSCPISDRLSAFWNQFSFPFVFQGDLWWKPRWHVYFFV